MKLENSERSWWKWMRTFNENNWPTLMGTFQFHAFKLHIGLSKIKLSNCLVLHSSTFFDINHWMISPFYGKNPWTKSEDLRLLVHGALFLDVLWIRLDWLNNRYDVTWCLELNKNRFCKFKLRYLDVTWEMLFRTDQ